MLDFLPATLEGWVAVTVTLGAAGFSVISFICGAVWWCSAMYSELKSLRLALQDHIDHTKALDARLDRTDEGVNERFGRIEHRVTRIEAKVGE